MSILDLEKEIKLVRFEWTVNYLIEHNMEIPDNSQDVLEIYSLLLIKEQIKDLTK